MKNKYTTIGIILTTIILAGVAIFTAIRLYQTRNTAVAPNVPSSKPAAQEVNVCSLSFTVGETQTVNCTSLTSNVTNPTVGQSVTGTCHGTFSSSVTAPVARFGVNLNGTPLGLSEAIPLNSAGVASYTTVVPQDGNYVVQCQICTDNTLSNCTTMDAVASSASCRLSFTVGGSTSSPTATATATSTSHATATATSTATATATSTSTAVATATATASPVPQCNNSCTNNADCPSGLMCRIASGTTGNCRNTQCLSETDCTCAVATSTSTSVAHAPVSTTQPTLPNAGTSWPTILGTGFGILVILGSLLLAL